MIVSVKWYIITFLFVYYFKEGIYIQSIKFSYFDTMVPTPNKQRFLKFVILPTYFCSDLSFLAFIYILLYCSFLGFSILCDAMKFEFNLFLSWLIQYIISVKSYNHNFNAVSYWKLAQLIQGGIIFDKLKNTLCVIFSYFYTRVPPPN